MAPRGGTRRPAAFDEEGESTPIQTQRNGRRESTPEDDDHDVDMDTQQDDGSHRVEQFSKGLVRYALSCEYARKPIKRTDINEKVLGSHSRLFREVFMSANSQLQQVFGMQMIELPKPERVTMRQKRAAAASDSQSKTSNMWILQTILPEQYRIPEIIGPSRPLEEDAVNREDAYVGLYTMAIALIAMSGGKITEGKLDRQLRRMNADQSTPIGSKDKTIAAMVKDGYIVKVKESSGGDEETVDYVVGPRGKVEVGREGVAKLVRTIYGEGEDQDALERRIQRTLDVAEASGSGLGDEEQMVVGSLGRKRGRPRNDGDEL